MASQIFKSKPDIIFLKNLLEDITEKENEKYIVIEINPGIICNLGTNFDETRDVDYLKLTNLINDELNDPFSARSNSDFS